ncbi:MAG: transposase [Micromonosporaceae bacterium]|nr:transposase [Micromonosporaceae bacterium]
MPAPHPPEFRRRAVELARRGDAPIAAVAKQLSISESCLRDWMAQADADENGSESRVTSAEKRELAQLRRDKKLTSGCAWRHLPPGFGVSPPTAHRRFQQWTRRGCGRSCTGLCWTGMARPEGSTGRRRSWTRPACGRKGGLADGSEPRRPRQEGLEDPRVARRRRTAARRGGLRSQPARQPGLHPAGHRHPGHPLTARPTPAPAGQGACRQGLRPRSATRVPAPARHRPAHRPAGHRVHREARPAPLEDREDDFSGQSIWI